MKYVDKDLTEVRPVRRQSLLARALQLRNEEFIEEAEEVVEASMQQERFVGLYDEHD